MDLGLDGRTAVVMGASQGLGEATARQLAEEGAHVILVARREDALKEVQQKIQDAGGSADIALCDLFDSESRQSLCNLIENLSRIDVLVANSGVRPRGWRRGSLRISGPRNSTRWCSVSLRSLIPPSGE